MTTSGVRRPGAFTAQESKLTTEAVAPTTARGCPRVRMATTASTRAATPLKIARTLFLRMTIPGPPALLLVGNGLGFLQFLGWRRRLVGLRERRERVGQDLQRHSRSHL